MERRLFKTINSKSRVSIMSKTTIPGKIEKLTEHLQEIRRASLIAARQGDYLRIGRLTAEAASLNKAIIEAEGLVMVGMD
jgi:hypothetical protein